MKCLEKQYQTGTFIKICERGSPEPPEAVRQNLVGHQDPGGNQPQARVADFEARSLAA